MPRVTASVLFGLMTRIRSAMPYTSRETTLRSSTMLHRRLALIAALFLAAPALAQQPPLRTGVDGTFAPHAMPKLGGGTEGFQIDLFTEVARRMKREITIDAVSFSTLIPGMMAGRYDFIAAPTTVTKERAENMLFTAGYLWTAYQFGIRKGSAPIKDWSDLKGKAVAVNKGTPYETMSKAEGAKHGFEVQPYDTQPDAIQAVLSGRAYAVLGGNTTIVYAASRNPNFVADLELTHTRAHWAAPFPKQSVALRNQMQDVINCMKQDGTIVKLSEKWFGRVPPPDALERVITPGYGVPGMPGYEPTPQVHALKCG
jgi:polar amino acid transport system substrate-binding protein